MQSAVLQTCGTLLDERLAEVRGPKSPWTLRSYDNLKSWESRAAHIREHILVTAGWSSDQVNASEAGTTDFAETTVYYAFPDDEAAAAGIADLLGGARIEQSDFYQPVDDTATEDVDESQSSQLTVVIGLDRTADAPEETPAP